MMAGIYIHIPFCKQACYYCDFHFSTQKDQYQDMVQAMSSEIGIQKHYLGDELITTIYFGGGTPSLLPSQDLKLILETIRQNFRVDDTAEITVEANPDDLSEENLIALRRIGVNRLSIGIQSFQDETLKYFNRAHTAGEATTCIINARRVGFNNISIDLIYGVPGLNSDKWIAEIQKALSFKPEHISAYSLTIEEKTVFGRRHAKGQLIPLPEEEVAVQLEILMDQLAHAGYEHYEISNFALPGRRSQHNTSYWEQKPYLGVGPSAHSYDGKARQFNIANNTLYIKSIAEGRVPFEREILTRETLINEYIMTRLRTSDGLRLSYLSSKHGFDLMDQHRDYLQRLVSLGNVSIEGDVVRLSDRGKLLADKISGDLFVISE